MKKYIIKIEGVTPLVYDRMKKELADEMKKLAKRDYDIWEEKNWKRKAEYDKQNRLIIPPEWIMNALKNAAKMSRIRPTKFSSSSRATYTNYLQTCMVIPTFVLDGKEDESVTLENVKPYSNYQIINNSKVWKIKPMLEPPWRAELTFYDPMGYSLKDEIENLFNFAGMFIGIGSDRKLGFGRFKVSDIQVEEKEKMEVIEWWKT